MDEYLKRRSFLDTKLGRLKSKVESLDDQPNRIMCEMLEEQLKELWTEINSCADDIMTLCEAEDAEDHENVFAGMFDSYDSVNFQLRIKLAMFVTTIQERAATRGVGNHVTNNAVKLYKLEPPSFSGNFLEWTSFADLFKASVHNQPMSGAQKLQYLRTALKGEALKLIEGYFISDVNYEEAWRVLEKRYQNNRELVRSQVVKFFSQPYLKEKSATGLRSLLDTSTSCVLALKTMGYNIAVDEDNYWLTFSLMERLDPETRELWESKIGRSVLPKWSNLIEFLDDRVSILSSAAIDVRTNLAKKPSNDKKQVSAHQASANIACPVCNDSHFVYQCKKFIDMNVADRKACVDHNQLCSNCLKVGQDISKCAWGGSCRKCKEKHNTLLHTTSNFVAPSTNTISAHTASASNRALMATAQILVEDCVGNQHEFRALLDPGADVSFVSEDVAQQLRLKRKRTDISISGVGSSCPGTVKSSLDLVL